MRVLFVIESLVSQGGAERAIMRIASALLSKGVEITLASNDPVNTPLAYDLPEGVRLVRIPGYPAGHSDNIRPPKPGYPATFVRRL